MMFKSHRVTTEYYKCSGSFPNLPTILLTFPAILLICCGISASGLGPPRGTHALQVNNLISFRLHLKCLRLKKSSSGKPK